MAINEIKELIKDEISSMDDPAALEFILNIIHSLDKVGKEKDFI